MTRPVLRDRDLRVLLIGQALSMFGDSLLLLALAVWVKDLTGSNGAAGALILVVVAPTLAAPLAGYVVDRVRRRRFLVWVNLGSVVIVLPLLFVGDDGGVPVLFAVGFLYGVSFVLIAPARSALIEAMAPHEAGALASINGAMQTSREACRLLGPLLGAALYATVGGGLVALIDAATFVGAALTLQMLRFADPVPERVPSRFRAEISAGARHIWRTRILRRMLGTAGVALLVVGFCEAVTFAVVDDGLHRSPAFLGVLSTAQGVGAVAGGLSAARLIRRAGEAAVLGLGLLALGIGSGMWAASNVPVVAAGFAVFGAGVPWAVVAMMTILQRLTPSGLQGRVASAAEMLIGAPQTLSIGVGAIAVSLVDYRILLAAMMVVLVGCAVSLLARRPAEGGDPQIAAVVALVRDVLGPDLVAAYLHGSAVRGGLRPRSDLDLLVVSARPTTLEEKRRLVERLLVISTPGGPGRAVELTIVVHGDVRPWRYPPRFDFQYGDWMRREFEAGDVEPWPSTTNPDLASLLTMTRERSETLVGPPATEVLDPVPREDVLRAMVGDIDRLVAELDVDTRNVILTLARIWTTLETGEIRSKDEAAAWAIDRIPAEDRCVLARARAVYLGDEDERWDDLVPTIRPTVDVMVESIRRLAPVALATD